MNTLFGVKGDDAGKLTLKNRVTFDSKKQSLTILVALITFTIYLLKMDIYLM